MREAFFRIADLKNSAGHGVAVGVYDERVVRPFADFMRQGRDILREGARRSDIGRMGISLGSREAAERTVIPTDTASPELGEIGVIGEEDRQRVRNDLGAVVLHVILDL